MASTILFYADYLKAGVGTTPSAAPTIAVYAVNRSTGVETLVGSAGASMTASALAGRYYFRVASADLSTNDYHARAHTSDTLVDQQDVPALWVRWSEADSAAIQTNLDATISSRSTYAGGPVASVTAPVTVGTNSDKTGYALATAPPTTTQIAAAILSTPTHLLATDVSGGVTLPSPAPTGYGGPSIQPATGTVQASPTPTATTFAISAASATTTPASGAWVGQMCFRSATGERRFITAHTVSGTGSSAIHTIALGSSTGLNGPFASAPTAGESLEVA